MAQPGRFIALLIAGAIASSIIVPASATPPVMYGAPPCTIRAYLAGSRGTPVNLRRAPDLRSPVVARINNEILAVARLRQQRNGWFRADLLVDAEHGDRPIYRGNGWIHRSQLGLDVAGGDHWLRSEPSPAGQRLLRLVPDGSQLSLVDCRFEWAKVKVDGRKIGWLAPDAQCASPMTTCS